MALGRRNFLEAIRLDWQTWPLDGYLPGLKSWKKQYVGVRLMEANSFPRLQAWTRSFKEDPMIKGKLPDRDEMLTYFKSLREKFIASETT